ncbi:MAG: hypothetical protein AAFR59_12630 [Bacteroidota bacterium]
MWAKNFPPEIQKNTLTFRFDYVIGQAITMLDHLSLLYTERRLVTHLELCIREGQPVTITEALTFVNQDFGRLETLLRVGIIYLRKRTVALHIEEELDQGDFDQNWNRRLDFAVTALTQWSNLGAHTDLVQRTRRLCETGERLLYVLRGKDSGPWIKRKENGG